MAGVLVEYANSTDTEISQAVALLKKNGFGAIAITTSMGPGTGTKVVIELIIGGPPRESCLKKTIFENSWLTLG